MQLESRKLQRTGDIWQTSGQLVSAMLTVLIDTLTFYLHLYVYSTALTHECASYSISLIIIVVFTIHTTCFVTKKSSQFTICYKLPI